MAAVPHCFNVLMPSSDSSQNVLKNINRADMSPECACVDCACFHHSGPALLPGLLIEFLEQVASARKHYMDSEKLAKRYFKDVQADQQKGHDPKRQASPYTLPKPDSFQVFTWFVLAEVGTSKANSKLPIWEK